MAGAEPKVAAIVGALSALEDDLDSLAGRVAEMRKGLAARARSEVDGMMARTREMAAREAESIIGGARAEAEAESARIARDGEARLEEARSRIESGRDEAVRHVVSAVMRP